LHPSQLHQRNPDSDSQKPTGVRKKPQDRIYFGSATYSAKITINEELIKRKPPIISKLICTAYNVLPSGLRVLNLDLLLRSEKLILIRLLENQTKILTEKEMKWTLRLEMWDNQVYNNNLKPVFTDIIDKFEKLIDKEPILGYKPLWIINDPYYGMRIYKPLSEEYYKIGLTVGHLTYGKVAYQFSHMLSILYTDPRQITWLATAIAHMASFKLLDHMAEYWVDNHPGEGYEGEYESFSSLKTEKIKTAFQNVDIMLNLASNEWIKEEVKKLDQGTEHTPPVLFDLIGMELEPLFKDENCWKILPYLGLGTRTPIDDIHDLRCRPRAKPDFDRLRDVVPADLKNLVDNIYERLHY
jgi:hypothetical protein